jgi:hypothetical protein
VIRIYDWKLQGEALVSSVGMSACGHASAGWFGKIDLGFGYRWSNQDLQIMGASCDVGRYRAVSRAARVGEPRTADIPAGLRVATLAVQGADAPPVVKVTGPRGETSVSPSEPGQTTDGKFLFFRNPDDNTTYVALAQPSGGTWKVEAEDGSAPITSMQQANGLPEPDVDGKVTGKGRSRTLSYSVKPIPGQTVRFVEQGKDATRVLGVARGRRGKVRFTPATGSAGRRKITALIEQDGVVRDQVTAATYSAPKPVRPGKVTRLSVKRSGSNLRVSWKKSTGSVRYAVHVVGADGRATTVTAEGTSATVPDTGAKDAARVTVAGIGETGAFGPGVKVKIARGARASR